MYRGTNARKSRKNNGWKRGKNEKKRKFTQNTIDIRKFINKSDSLETKTAEAFVPRYSFEELNINGLLKRSIANRGYLLPTPIQDKSIPVILAGKDVIGLANTGTGKTAAFLIPMINKVLFNPKEKILIVTPTRELAIQIQEELIAFAKEMRIGSVVIVGGANIQRQISDLRRPNNFVIGTPGRLKDLIGRKVLDLSRYNNIILDEADRMLDMGFISDVRFFLSLLNKRRQTLLFSATFSSEIEELVNSFLCNPEMISFKTKETPKQIDQDIVRVSFGQDKIEILHKLLSQTQFEKVLIFARTKYGAEKLSRKLFQKGFKAEAIHGDKPHNKRQRVLKMFKQSSIDILVATDVAARGLDIPNVSHVINFDVPATYEDYIHRIGRTGRADKLGKALTFVN